MACFLNDPRILSALAHWSAIFENLDYLPAMVFPFARLFQKDLFSGIEVIMTILGINFELTKQSIGVSDGGTIIRILLLNVSTCLKTCLGTMIPSY